MKRTFQCKTVPSTWLVNNGRRLDCGPYLSGAVEAKEILRRHSTAPLKDLTAGHYGGIFNGPRFPRIYVENHEHGVPFLGSTDILEADLSHLSLLSKKQVANNPSLVLDEGWTLITCSGTIGRMAYSRPDMKGMAGSQHFMRVCPAKEKIPPGYLYAFLSSRFGVPMVISGTYGAIIQHIEPHHIADLPIPRLGDVEDEAHELVQRAADLRSEASQMIFEQIQSLEVEIGGGDIAWKHKSPQSFDIEPISSKSLKNRFDAFHYIGFVGEAFKNAKVDLVPISQYANALYPPFLKRIRADEGGIEFLGGTEALTLTQKSDLFVSSRSKNIEKFIVKRGFILFQCDGQRYGIFGRPILANRSIIGKAVTQHMMRIIPNSTSDSGYIFIYLATEFGRRFIMRFSAGTSIPSLNENGARQILIYWPEKQRRREIGKIAEKAWEDRAKATEIENQARALVENTIEHGAP